MITNKNFVVIKNQVKKSHKNICQQWVEANSAKKGKSKDKDYNKISQTIWTRVLHYIKFKSSLEHKNMLNSAISSLKALMMISSEFWEDPKNNKINSWSERNLMVLNKTIIEVWNK